VPSTQSEAARVRSPSFPFISLREAEDRARAFHQEEKRNAAPPQVAFAYWGYHSPKSSGGPRTLAALRAYGLLEGDEEVRLTGLALAILQKESPAERQAQLREAALLPPVHRTIWSAYSTELPSDATLRAFLEKKLAFNPDAVPGFLRNYRETLAFAGLVSGAPPPERAISIAPSPTPQSPEPHPEGLVRVGFPLGDGSALEVRAPRKVTRIEADQLRVFFELWLKTITAP
jgi:hypothetical protein